MTGRRLADTVSWAAGFRLRQYVRQSLWVVPLLGALVGAALAQLDLWFEDRIDLPPNWTYSAGTATSVLSAVAAAMVGLLGFVVTIGVLVVQMATGTLSPRFTRLWYRDRLQKLVLASFVATFAFSFALLRSVESDSVPDLGVTMAGVAVTGDLILLLTYLDRFVHALRPVAVAAAMARAGLDIAVRAGRVSARSADRDGAEDWADHKPDLRVLAPRAGAIQAVDTDAIIRFAAARDLVCVLPHTIGDFVTTGSVLVEVHGKASARDGRSLTRLVALGRERTIDQDPAFALRILVDIAIRALSPAVNDPTTATQVVNYIGDLLLGLGSTDPIGLGLRLDNDGRVRLVFQTRSWTDYLDLGVTEIRHYGATSTQTCRRLRAMLEDLRAGVLPAYRAAVEWQLDALDRATTAAFADPHDRAFALTSDRQGIGGAIRSAGSDDGGR